MRIDQYGMFESRPTGKMSWQSHVDEYESTQRGLRRKLEKAEEKGCFAYDFDAWSWASKPAPSQPAP